ncbi:MAG: DUF3108 domain-containing protein [Cyclobacteriaceae bacterium]|nr:DUF3108 domain-containing protein [Cyclobacteriaceae bacterium]
MKKLIVSLLAMVALSSFLAAQKKVIPVTKNNSYSAGEELEYRVNFGFMTVGKGITRVDNKIHEINSRPCYKVDAFGETSGWISWISKVDDNWGAYIDTASLNTQVAYRKLKEGKYRRDELVTFDHAKNKVEVKVKNRDTGKDDVKSFDVPKNTKDLVAGFLHLRVIDFAKVIKGDTIVLSGFLEDAAYNLKIIYVGKDVVDTRVGKIRCHKLRPVMPANSMFDGEDSILCWISDDMNKIPVKIQAKMFIGSTGLELISFRGLRNQLKTVN